MKKMKYQKTIHNINEKKLKISLNKTDRKTK